MFFCLDLIGYVPCQFKNKIKPNLLRIKFKINYILHFIHIHLNSREGDDPSTNFVFKVIKNLYIINFMIIYIIL